MEYAVNKLIAALSTPPGAGAIAVLRLSGTGAIALASRFFRGADLGSKKTHTLSFGMMVNEDGQRLDEVVVSIYRAPASYTGEEVVEISCHGSRYIQHELLQLMLHHGARLAEPGEFTMRAYLNGKLDLSQAEAVGDLIAAEHEAAHRLALRQMRGGYSEHLATIRSHLIEFAALVELELDFGEEDVEFANRNDLRQLIQQIDQTLKHLISSFKTGQAIKHGIPVVIAGKPNAGKSTLLNALLNEDKAIISDIPGTTRDVIEDTLVIDGMLYRLYDTAGLRETDDPIERMGVEKTMSRLESAAIIVYLFDLTKTTPEMLMEELAAYTQKGLPVIIAGNKADVAGSSAIRHFTDLSPVKTGDVSNAISENLILISAHRSEDVERIKLHLSSLSAIHFTSQADHIVSHARHYEALRDAREALHRVSEGLQAGISGDLLAMDIREVVRYIGSITGTVDADDLLEYIFGRFCIGK